MTKQSNASPSRYDVEGRYTALLGAGEILLCNGYDLAQPKLIAKTAGVSVGLFYRHFQNKQELLAAIMVERLEILHRQIEQEIESSSDPIDSLHITLIMTLRYFQAHQGLIKLFFMQIGYGDPIAIVRLREVRQTYRDIWESIIRSGITNGVFIASEALDIQTAINSIIGTINWSLYDILIVKNEDLESSDLEAKLSTHILRGLGYEFNAESHSSTN